MTNHVTLYLYLKVMHYFIQFYDLIWLQMDWTEEWMGNQCQYILSWLCMNEFLEYIPFCH